MHTTQWDQINKSNLESYFPLLIQMVISGKRMVVDTSKNIPVGVTFTVIQTRFKGV